MPRYNAPVSSFGSELQDALRRGCEGELHLDFESPTIAQRFFNRANHLRVAMKREKHPQWEALYRCGIYVKGSRVTLRPRDVEFRTALAAAKVGPQAISPQLATALPSDSAIDNFLSDLSDSDPNPSSPPKNPPEGG